VSLTLEGALKALLESKSLSISVSRDVPPGGTKLPYCTAAELSLALDPMEDGGPANGAEATGSDLLQLDLWQTWKVADKVVESPTLADAIERALHGASLNFGTPNKRVYSVLLNHPRIRRVDRDANLTNHTWTLDLRRVI
jgi:hypothetical protein